jgi:2-iminobutanoate/2-iminopropanoate deaminase
MPTQRHLTFPAISAADAPYSHLVDCGDTVYVAGQIAADAPGFNPRTATIEDETRIVLGLIGDLLAQVGLTLSDIVQVTVYLTDLSLADRMNAVYARAFAPDRRPARTCVGVNALLDGAAIEIACIARRPRAV